jgi:hypothetical protein
MSIAKNWAFHVEYDQHYLHGLRAGLKSLLLSYIATYSDGNGGGVGIAGLRVLFRDSEDEDFTTLDLSRSLGPGLAMSQLELFLRPYRPTEVVGPAAAAAESWDSAPRSGDYRRLPALTHLSLAYPLERVSWPALLSVVKIVPTITHLSLAGWSLPDPHAVRPLAKALLCLKWLDVSDCPCLLYEKLMEVEWWGVWRGVETVVATQESEVESAEVRNLRREKVKQLADFIKASRQEKGGKWCKILV